MIAGCHCYSEQKFLSSSGPKKKKKGSGDCSRGTNDHRTTPNPTAVGTRNLKLAASFKLA